MHRRHALLVEDDHSSRLIAESRLELLGFAVTVVEDAFEAREVLDGDRHFDLAVLDFRLPGMNGGELATIIRATMRRRHLPILLVTADLQVALPGIVDHVLHKPYERHEFNQAIEKVLGRTTQER